MSETVHLLSLPLFFATTLITSFTHTRVHAAAARSLATLPNWHGPLTAEPPNCTGVSGRQIGQAHPWSPDCLEASGQAGRLSHRKGATPGLCIYASVFCSASWRQQTCDVYVMHCSTSTRRCVLTMNSLRQK